MATWWHHRSFHSIWWSTDPEENETHRTFGEGDGSKVVGIHDLFVKLQGNLVGRPLHFHTGIVDKNVHTAIAVQDLFGHILNTADVREIQEDQLWGECLLEQGENQDMFGVTSYEMLGGPSIKQSAPLCWEFKVIDIGKQTKTRRKK